MRAARLLSEEINLSQSLQTKMYSIANSSSLQPQRSPQPPRGVLHVVGVDRTFHNNSDLCNQVAAISLKYIFIDAPRRPLIATVDSASSHKMHKIKLPQDNYIV
ncbi:hypothetical protein PoB_007118100 [Plakobranchus ocellatus]|uniref:Uncharacterized protein n=1 Tax=Plakobranchus ocellatus TaxID=259542 RepID=A0AAV4DKG8_9GAST|nr:hypothetical protein PoB_007118100 [Plakobranchus ocellatus]